MGIGSGILLSMATLTELLIPAGAALVGAVVGGGATLAGQILTHRGTFQREREARQHALLVKQHEIQFETLLAMQEAVTEHFQKSVEIGALGRASSEWNERAQELRTLEARLLMLRDRIHARELASVVGGYMATAAEARHSGDEHNQVSHHFTIVQAALGAALRTDPFGTT